MPPTWSALREAILVRGGAVHANVFTRALLSLYGVLGWRSVPEMPVEIMLLPRWFPFLCLKVSYWARTVIVPLLVLQALRPRAKNPLAALAIDELFVDPPERVGPDFEGGASKVGSGFHLISRESMPRFRPYGRAVLSRRAGGAVPSIACCGIS